MVTWQNTAWEIESAAPDLALLPLAAYEPHGPHLPLDTDLIIMNAITSRVAEQVGGSLLVLPVWPLGTSAQQAGQPGLVSLGFETLWAVVRDVVVSLFDHGIKRVVVLNNHGAPFASTALPFGNFIVKTAVRQLNYEVPGLTALWVQPFAAGGPALKALFSAPQHEVHAGALETSILLHLAPDLVGVLPPDHIPPVSPANLNFTAFHHLAPAGVWGRPTEATAAKGAQALDLVTQATADYIQRTFAQLSEIKQNSF